MRVRLDRGSVRILETAHVPLASNSVPPYQEKEVMNDQTAKLLVVESDDALRATLVAVLGDAGYEVSTDYH